MYRALYRKWRPQRFADVVGQTAIVTALQNQISAGRIGHAYLFTGTRGTGKTTCAKIFAKAVNCLDTSSPDPCGECEICKGIDSGSVMDIIEMDAASNNGVDDIRKTLRTPLAVQCAVHQSHLPAKTVKRRAEHAAALLGVQMQACRGTVQTLLNAARFPA